MDDLIPICRQDVDAIIGMDFKSGEGGIRTHDRVLPYTRLAGERLQPTRPPLRK